MNYVYLEVSGEKKMSVQLQKSAADIVVVPIVLEKFESGCLYSDMVRKMDATGGGSIAMTEIISRSKTIPTFHKHRRCITKQEIFLGSLSPGQNHFFMESGWRPIQLCYKVNYDTDLCMVPMVDPFGVLNGIIIYSDFGWEPGPLLLGSQRTRCITLDMGDGSRKWIGMVTAPGGQSGFGVSGPVDTADLLNGVTFCSMVFTGLAIMSSYVYVYVNVTCVLRGSEIRMVIYLLYSATNLKVMYATLVLPAAFVGPEIIFDVSKVLAVVHVIVGHVLTNPPSYDIEIADADNATGLYRLMVAATMDAFDKLHMCILSSFLYCTSLDILEDLSALREGILSAVQSMKIIFCIKLDQCCALILLHHFNTRIVQFSGRVQVMLMAPYGLQKRMLFLILFDQQYMFSWDTIPFLVAVTNLQYLVMLMTMLVNSEFWILWHSVWFQHIDSLSAFSVHAHMALGSLPLL